MTNRLALVLGALLVGFFLLDAYVLHLGAPLFLAGKIGDLMNYIAFWH
jgi:hypothetical protein